MSLRPFAALAFAATLSAQTYTLKPFAGGALPENAAGVNASLGNVYGAAVDRAGNLFLSLGDYNIVVRLDATTGVLTRVAGTGTMGFAGDNGPATSAQLSGPTGVAVDATGNLFIADSGNSRIRMVSPAGLITTIAGDGTRGYSGNGGPALAARFDGIGDIALDAAGNLVVADFYNQVIRKIVNGVIYTVAGDGTFGTGGDNGPAISAQLAGPSGLSVDATGAVYFAEGYSNRIRKVANGIITTVAGNGTAGYSGDKGPATAATLRQPSDVSVDSSGNLYIADFGNYRIRMVSNGAITTIAGNGGAGYSGDHVAAISAGLAGPQKVLADSSGNLHIVDTSRIRKVANGTITTMAGGGAPAGEGGAALNAQLLTPQGVAVDGSGSVYVSDMGTGRVLKVSGGVLTRVAGSATPGFSGDGGAAASAQLSGPNGVAVDPAGNLYVADSQNGRIRKVSGGTISTVAGGGSGFGDNGQATNAQLTNPQGIAVDAAGSIYVADLNRVRLVSNGNIKTVAGNGSVGYQGDGGLATAAMLSNPSGLTLDSAGNLIIADYGNNRVRAVTNGIASTVAGTGTYGFGLGNGNATNAMLGAPAGVAADAAGNLYITDAYRILKVSKGKITTLAGLSAPQGIAVDTAGNVYVAEPASHRVWVLAPSGATCAVTVTPASSQAPAAGGRITLSIQTGASCPWAIDTVPDWLTLSGAPYGTGTASVVLTAPANADSPRSAVIQAGGQSITVIQAGMMTIAGQVTLSGAPLPGVKLAISGSQASATTDSGGNFAVGNLDSTGSYTVTPSLAGYSFVPTSLTFTNASANPTANFVAWPIPQAGAIAPVYASLLQPMATGFAPGEIVSIYGTNLCAEPGVAAAPTLPDRLAGCIVQVDGTAVRLYYGSSGQINAVLPQNIAVGAHQLVVQRYSDSGYKQLAGQSQPISFTVNRISMALIERPDGQSRILLAQFPDGGLVGIARPARGGDYLTFYLTGLGRKAQTFAEGAAPKTTSGALESVQVTIQGQPAQITYSGVQPQYPGLDQITVQTPKFTLPAGASTVTVQITAPSTGQTLRYEINAL